MTTGKTAKDKSSSLSTTRNEDKESINIVSYALVGILRALEAVTWAFSAMESRLTGEHQRT
jgi:hypothetical protein